MPENSTTKELAAYLNMRVPALAQMRYRGTGPAYRKISARTVRYRKADVLAWLEGASRTQTKDHVA
ncbi:helix-turn-helix domain-containing protein [Frondihabitans sp. VKM Ac-2883]|nr:helix-turn-helix domain-containing protein [Frondihabitans sp. VKM Ac-2883]